MFVFELRTVLRVAALALAVAMLAAAPASAAKRSHGGIVYVDANLSGFNTVVALRYASNGALSPSQITEYPTRGSGAPEVPGAGKNMGVFDADQQITLDRKRGLLFAVNRASNSIAVFKVSKQGALTPVKGSPFPSGGETPESLGVSGRFLIVVNGSNRADIKTTSAPNYKVFSISSSGRLKPMATALTAPSGAQPEIALVSPNGKVVVGAEFGSQLIRSFTLSGSGTLAQAPGSPLKFDPSVTQVNDGRPLPPQVRGIPLGSAFNPKKPFVYVDAPLANRIVTYSYDNTGALHFQGFVENPGGFTPCWNRVTSDGRYMYVSNTNSGNISVFSLANPARPQQIQLVAPFGGGGPNSIELDPRGKLLFALAGHDDPDSPDLSPFADGNVVHTFRIGADGKLSEFPARPAFLPLPTGDKPEGIATLGL